MSAARHRPVRRTALAALLGGVLLVATGVGPARADRPGADDGPAVDVAALGERVEQSNDDRPGVSGEEAVAALEETNTTEIAAANAGLEPAELVEELREDPAMFVTADAMVGYVETLDETATLNDQPAPAAALAPATCGDPFYLDSLPGAGKVLYLDFTGHTTVGQWWNANYSQATITSTPYTGGGAAICEIWRRVAEDFLPFGVNVTTRDPGVEGLRKTAGGDAFYGQRMVITPSNFTGSPSTLGIALLDVFDASEDLPAFVFTASSTMSNPANVAEAISHEAGHTFSLLHDGTSGGDYYSGHNGWAPLMGNPINRPMTQWSRGEYDGANNNGEDDIGVIAWYAGYRPDDIGNSTGTATRVACDAVIEGRIGTSSDVDVFAVQVAAGQLTATLTPSEVWGNLHASVTIRNSGGSVVAGPAQPAQLSGWTASATANLSAGTYYLEVRPTAWGTPQTGFSTYGSVGAYRLTVAGQPVGSGCTSTLTPVAPNRVLDTRNGIGGYSRVPGGHEVVVQVAGTSGVPYGATAAVVNLTAVGPSGWGFLTAYPCSGAVPTTSNVNYVGGQVVSNSTIAALSPAGQICVWTYADADILVDVTGWLGPTGTSKLTQAGPARVADTRNGVGGTRLAAGATLPVDFTGWVPAGTTAVSFNITATGASAAAFMTAYPCGQGRPDTSVINYSAGEDRANNVIVGLGTGNKVCIYSYAATDVIIDMTGYFSPSGPLSYKPVAPDRVLDSRGGIVQPPKPAGSVLQYSVNRPGLGGLDPDAAFVNVTAVDHTNYGFVTTFNCSSLPNASTVNQRVGQENANGAIVPLTSDSRSCAWLSDPGHLLVDLNGWWVH